MLFEGSYTLEMLQFILSNILGKCSQLLLILKARYLYIIYKITCFFVEFSFAWTFFSSQKIDSFCSCMWYIIKKKITVYVYFDVFPRDLDRVILGKSHMCDLIRTGG